MSAFLRLVCLVIAWGLTLPIHADLLVKDGQKVAFLGDSITAYGWGMPGGYIKLVVAGLATEGVKIEAIPAGVPGNTSKDMLARLDESILSKKPDWMTLSCGVNDVWHGANGVDLENYKKNVTAIVDQAQAKGIKVMILTATVIDEDPAGGANQKLSAYNDFLRKLARERRFPLADLNPAFQEAIGASANAAPTKPKVASPLVLTVDGVHPNPKGHRIMARGIMKSFGMPDSDSAKVEAAWNAIPDAGTISVRQQFNAAAPLSLIEYDFIDKAASAQGVPMSVLSNTLFLQAVRETLQAHASDASVDAGKLQPEINAAFTKLVKEFVAKQPQAPASTPKSSP